MITLLILLAVLGFDQAETASSASVPHQTRFKMVAAHEGKCINLYLTACNPPKECQVTLHQKRGSSESISGPSLPDITPDNSSYVYCYFDLVGSKVNSSICCKNGNSHGLRLSDHDYISFKSKVCSPAGSGGSLCVTSDWHKFIVPTKNMCDLRKPCRNNARCLPSPNAYNCSCTSGLQGKNCDVPTGYKKISKSCLDTQRQPLETRANKTVTQCAFYCKSYHSCKSFEFSHTPVSDIGTCVLRDEDNMQSLEHKICSADYFEPAPTPKGPTGSVSIATSAPTLLFMMFAVVMVMSHV